MRPRWAESGARAARWWRHRSPGTPPARWLWSIRTSTISTTLATTWPCSAPRGRSVFRPGSARPTTSCCTTKSMASGCGCSSNWLVPSRPGWSSPAFKACCSRCPAAKSSPARRGASPAATRSTSRSCSAGWSTNGFQNTSAVELPGEFSPRGGILDIFAPDWFDPVRIEFFGDEVESIRRFEVATQRSLESLDVDRRHAAGRPSRRPRTLLPATCRPIAGSTWSSRPTSKKKAAATSSGSNARRTCTASAATMRQITRFPSVTAAGVPAGSLETTCHLGIESVERFSGDIDKVRDELEASMPAAARRCSSSARPRPRASGCKRSSPPRGWPRPAGCTSRSAASRPGSAWWPTAWPWSAAASCSTGPTSTAPRAAAWAA